MSKKEGKKKQGSHHPWRENIEAITMAIIVAVMFKYFVVEAYKIPTGSMQPTLLGNEETRIFDRIIVDKLSYHFRDPERWEVTVFKYPLDRSKNFIKRLVGMPGEELSIRMGDLWARPDPDSDWELLRRPRPVREATWKKLHPGNPRLAEWRVERKDGDWKVDGRANVRARGDGSVLLPSDRGSVRDNYRDGYPGKMGSKIKKGFHNNDVGDLRIRGEVQALPGLREATIELREGSRRYLFHLPGPAAAEDALVRIVVEDLGTGGNEPQDEALLETGWKLPAGRKLSFSAENHDDLLRLEVEGLEPLELAVEPALDQRSWFRLRSEGEGCDFTSVELYRDIFYTTGNTPAPHRWTIPEGHYFMLGDNTQDSSDSRAWLFDRWSWPGEGSEGEIVRANLDGARNPLVIPGDPKRGTMVWMWDEWGELYVFPRGGAEQHSRERSPFVPRHLIAGRAVLVFWPYVPNLGVWRLKWIR